MSVNPQVDQSFAVLSVLAERERQVQHKGYTRERDATYTNGQLTEAAMCYAHASSNTPRGKPASAWPFAPEMWKPSERRRNLVKAAALFLAELDRLDNAPIQSVAVERDAAGWWSHPDFLAYYDEEITSAEFDAWCRRKQVTTMLTYMEGEVSHDDFDRYMDDGQCNCTAWAVDPPEGLGWFMLSIHDHEDGPVCVWGRSVAAQ